MARFVKIVPIPDEAEPMEPMLEISIFKCPKFEKYFPNFQITVFSKLAKISKKIYFLFFKILKRFPEFSVMF